LKERNRESNINSAGRNNKSRTTLINMANEIDNDNLVAEEDSQNVI